MSDYREITGLDTEKQVFEDKSAEYRMLEKAWQVRDFEIELLWKRTNYFAILVGALFVAYYSEKMTNHKDVIAFLGCISSFVWYLSNRGSKFWQENWESHIYLLETEIGSGILYNIHLKKNSSKWWCFLKAYPFSVTKLNSFISLIIFLSWCVVFFDMNIFIPKLLNLWIKPILLIGTLLCIVAFCRTTFNNSVKKQYYKNESNNT